LQSASTAFSHRVNHVLRSHKLWLFDVHRNAIGHRSIGGGHDKVGLSSQKGGDLKH
jgi:hypothetical protein